jgi:hypothetical protein
MIPRPIGSLLDRHRGTNIAGDLDIQGPGPTRNHDPSTPRDHVAWCREVPRDLVGKLPCPIANEMARLHVQRAAPVPWSIRLPCPVVPSRQGPSRHRESSGSMDLGALTPRQLAIAVPMAPRRPGGQAAVSNSAPSSHRPPRSPGLMGPSSPWLPRSHIGRIRHDSQFNGAPRCSSRLARRGTSVPSGCVSSRCQGGDGDRFSRRRWLMGQFGPSRSKASRSSMGQSYRGRRWASSSQVPGRL